MLAGQEGLEADGSDNAIATGRTDEHLGNMQASIRLLDFGEGRANAGAKKRGGYQLTAGAPHTGAPSRSNR